MRRFLLHTSKGQLTVILALLAAIAAPHEGTVIVLRSMVPAAAAAALLDLAILRARGRRWEFPSGAVLTAMIAAMVLSAQSPWYVATIVSLTGVVAKYVLRGRGANIFNPAALGLIATYPLLNAGQSWWGALPDAPLAAQIALPLTGIFIVDRVNKMPLVVAFLGAYFLLFTAAAYAGNTSQVAEIFRAPDLHAALFFAFFILSDPPTSPVPYGDQMIFAVIVAMVSFAVFELTGAVYYLLAGVLVGNAWEGYRRSTLQRRKGRGRLSATF